MSREEMWDAPDWIAEGLYALSETLGRQSPANQAHGVLGGEWGYGQDFANGVFRMHPYCWCERDDCEWCAGCECPESATHYFVDGAEVPGFDEWMAFFKRETAPECDYSDEAAVAAWMARAEKANERRRTTHDAVCRYCRGEFGSAPHFEHFATGLRVSWYKWIGRGMEWNRDIDRRAWGSILDRCFASLVPRVGPQ